MKTTNPGGWRTGLEGRSRWLGLLLWLGLEGLVVTVGAHPSSGIVVDGAGAVIFVDERRNVVFRIEPGGRLQRWQTNVHGHELYRHHDGALYGDHLEYQPEIGGWRSSLWRLKPDGTRTNVYGPAPGFPPGLILDRGEFRYQSNANDDPGGVRPTITRRAPDGRTAVLAGGTPGTRDGRGVEAQLGKVGSMAWGPDGAIYFCEDDAVRRVSRDGEVTTLARGIRGENDLDLPVHRLWGLAVDETGRVWVADYGSRRVLRVARGGGVEVMLRAERPWSPTAVAVHGGALYVLEHGFRPPTTSLGPRVRKLGADGRVTVLATVED